MIVSNINGKNDIQIVRQKYTEYPWNVCIRSVCGCGYARYICLVKCSTRREARNVKQYLKEFDFEYVETMAEYGGGKLSKRKENLKMYWHPSRWKELCSR